jgi:uncharacterized BrkB/YihY/UPF0761 family membrane protein
MRSLPERPGKAHDPVSRWASRNFMVSTDGRGTPTAYWSLFAVLPLLKVIVIVGGVAPEPLDTFRSEINN